VLLYLIELVNENGISWERGRLYQAYCTLIRHGFVRNKFINFSKNNNNICNNLF
jgi:hypothetical protein